VDPKAGRGGGRDSWRPRCSPRCGRRPAARAGEVQAALGDGLAYTTVMTILNRLHAKVS